MKNQQVTFHAQGLGKGREREIGLAFLRLTNTQSEGIAKQLGVWRDGDDCRRSETKVEWARRVREAGRVDDLAAAVGVFPESPLPANKLHIWEKAGSGDLQDAAREIQELRARVVTAEAARDHWKEAARLADVERDRLRVKLEAFKECPVLLSDAQAERDDLKRERDEAREKAIDMEQRAGAALDERDELRAELDELHEIHKAEQDAGDELRALLVKWGHNCRCECGACNDLANAMVVPDRESSLQDRVKHAPKRQFLMAPAGRINRREHNFLTIERVDPNPGRSYFTVFINGQQAIDGIDAEELYDRIGVMLGEGEE